MKRLAKLLEKEKPSKIVSVGDVVSASMTKYGIFPHVMIVDNRVMRKPVKPFPLEAGKILHLKNPPGTLTDEAWPTINEALSQTQRMVVMVDGEEDLLTIVAVLCAPENSLVVYGQPHEGVVVVKATKQMKETMRRIVEAMETFSQS